MDEIFAKSRNRETIQTHTQKLIDNYELLKASGYLQKDKIHTYDMAIKKVLQFHDLGKLNYKFQNKIRKYLGLPYIKNPELDDYPEIPHERLSLAFISKEDQDLFKKLNIKGRIRFNDLVKYCIAFHHTRRPDIGWDKEVFEKFVTLDLEKNKSKIGIDYPLRSNINIEEIWQRIDDRFEDYFSLLVLIKGILHKCDYSASAGIEPEIRYTGNYHTDFHNWLPFKLRDYQKKVRKDSNKSIVLIASTGSGKTEYSMNWINGDKTFYLLGIRTAVNEMYKRFMTVFGDKNTTLLHGDTRYFLADETDDEDMYFEKLSKAYQFSYPITIATADQLVTSVFKYNGFELPYLTASYSKIVLDEIQSFSPEAIASIVVYLKEIHSLGGKFLLMTATLPPFIKKEFEELESIIFPEPVLTDVRRHRIKSIPRSIQDKETIELIKKYIQQRKKILIICNTVKKSQELYEELKDFRPNLLCSRFINRDRRQKETEIMRATNKNNAEPCIWITTQIVEASLDIDFDVLFTECSTIDSLFQRFGRCHRQREYKDNVPNIYVCCYDKSSKLIYDPELTERTWKVIKEYDSVLLTEDYKQAMINHVFSNIEETHYYQKYIKYKKLLAFGFRAKNKREAQELFRNIVNNYTLMPEPIYKQYREKIDSLIEDIDAGEGLSPLQRIKLKRELLDYTFSVQLYGKRKDLLEEIPSTFCKRSNICLIKGVKYSYMKGLTFIDEHRDYDNFIQ